ncbi:hypothetical protein GTZ99_10715 [Novosphingobium sp. FSY-8]|uniref:Dolichyl-phosphate-mannose-protein mannosyltransferase n=2 Tax=Novosphingobium ovatum TaxID=1908523 RepID=A0ABW9XES0_9SPHN|nr:hypothetical protein [Novosphingobium ovatum]
MPMLRAVGLALLLIVAMQWATSLVAITNLYFPDPDDTLRLVQVRDWLGGQGWYDLHQHRIDPAHGGVAMHWTRLVDLPIAAIIVILRPFAGQAGAELGALLIVPVLTLAAALLLTGRVIAERIGVQRVLIGCLLLAISVPVSTQIRPMRIDHHGWQVVAALLAVHGLMTRHARLGGWLSGVALGAGLAISLEQLPLTAVFAAIGAWRWLRGGEERFYLAHLAAGLTVTSVLGLALLRGPGDLITHCDTIAPVHLAAMAWGAMVTGVMTRLNVIRSGWVLGGFALAGAGALGIYLGAAPQCVGGSFNELSPMVRQLWYENVAEGLPIWRQDWPTALQLLVPGGLGLWASVRLIAVQSGEERVWWQEYTLLLGGALAIAIMVTRAGAVAGALAAVPLCWLIGGWLDRLGQRRWAYAPAIVLALMPSLPLTLYAIALPYVDPEVDESINIGLGLGNFAPNGRDGPDPASAMASAVAPGASGDLAQGNGVTVNFHVSSCRIPAAGAALNALPTAAILAPLDISPDLIYASHHSVLATGHHRGARGMNAVIAAFTGSADQARAIAKANGMTYVAMCPRVGEPTVYRKVAPKGFAAQLIRGQVPGWLQPVPLTDNSGLRLWRVVG